MLRALQALPAPSSHTLTACLLAVLDSDIRDAILRCLTVAEAGRGLAAACHTARDIVGAYEQWRPMWNSEDAVERLRWHAPWRLWDRARLQELESLARLLADELQPQGVISLRFCIASARAGTTPSLVGCHEMHVLQVGEYNQRMRHWAKWDASCSSEEMMWDRDAQRFRRKYWQQHTATLLQTMGLRFAAEHKTYICEPLLPVCLRK